MKHCRLVLALSAAGLGLVLTATAGQFTPWITYNPSPSAPLGFYRIKATSDLKRGDYVLTRVPDAFKSLVERRGYLPLNLPLIKRVVALKGDEVCRAGQQIFLNKKPVAEALLQDSQGRNLPVWSGCRRLGTAEFFALMHRQNSLDSRYFGPMQVGDIIGIAEPLRIWGEALDGRVKRWQR